MTCTKCGTENPAVAKFCVECGARLASLCPSCGTPYNPGAKFCLECGTSLATAATSSEREPVTRPPAPAAPSPATERRLVSVLFADLVGFTTLAEGRDSEAVRDLLARYFERASEVVGRYGGTVEKFIGDAVMAVWGTPTAHEDDAERAVRAALDLLDGVRALGQEAGAGELDARAAVMTGEATVTLGATNQGMVAGDLVNTASRLQGVAEPGAVLVGEETRRAAESAIAFEPVDAPSLKGKTLPVAAFRATRVVGTVGGVVRADSLEPPFVGRESEFRLLRDIVHATGRERRARLVSLIGQAGIGKSRLGWEFQKYLDGISEQMWWHHGRSPAYGDGVAFWALGEMVRKRAGLVEADDDVTARDRIRATIEEHVPDPEERTFVEPALLALLGLGEPPAGGRDRLFAGWRLFFERLSASNSVVLVFEDIHWSDDGMLDFIEHLLEWSRSYPILVVTLARPDLLDRRPSWGGAGRSATTLALGPLGEADMRLLLAGLVPGLPEPAVRSVLAQADGVPLYAVETVRMLLTDGRLEPDGEGRFRPTRRLDELEVPTSLQALIAARLDALDPKERALLQDASVLGKTFSPEALAAVGGVTGDELASRLRSLVTRELLVLNTDPASPERGQYGFVQALIREVAYSTISRRDRRARHLAAARYFESRGDDELASVLASHYLSAYRAAPDGPEGEAVRAQARIALRAAADRAASLGAYGNAVKQLQQALELGVGGVREEAELLEQAGRAADLNGQYDAAIDLFDRSVGRYQEADDPVGAGRATAGLGLALMNAGRLTESLQRLEDARSEVDPSLDVARAPIVARIAQAYTRLASGEEAIRAADEALAIAERHRMTELLVDALISRGAGLGIVGRTIEGIVVQDGAIRLAAEHGLIGLQMRAMTNATVQRMDEDPGEAFRMALAASAEARRYGIRNSLSILALNAAELAIRIGAWDAARAMLEETLALEPEFADRLVLLTQLSMMAVLRGNEDDPYVRELDAASADIPAGLERLIVTDLQNVRAQLRGDYEFVLRSATSDARTDELNAPALYERAARAALWLGDATRMSDIAQLFRALGRSAPFPAATLAAVDSGVAALAGRRDEAVDGYRDAMRRYETMGVHFDRALIALDAARALGPGSAEGSAALREARSTFERLGAVAVLAVADSLVTEPAARGARSSGVAATPAGSGLGER